MKDKKLFNFLLSDKQKAKLVSDSIKNGFSTTSSYLVKLIECGLPEPKSAELRQQLIEQKIDMLPGNIFTMLKNQSHEMSTALKDVNRRTFITFRIVAFILARTFLMEDGGISKDEMDEVNAFIEKEMDNFKKMSGEN